MIDRTYGATKNDSHKRKQNHMITVEANEFVKAVFLIKMFLKNFKNNFEPQYRGMSFPTVSQISEVLNVFYYF
jgi:hypothetical protein